MKILPFWTKGVVIWWLFNDDVRMREREKKGTTNSLPQTYLTFLIFKLVFFVKFLRKYQTLWLAQNHNHVTKKSFKKGTLENWQPHFLIYIVNHSSNNSVFCLHAFPESLKTERTACINGLSWHRKAMDKEIIKATSTKFSEMFAISTYA